MRKGMKVKATLVAAAIAFGLTMAQAAPGTKTPKGDVFYVYTEGGSNLNHYAPSGWMGDYGDLRINPRWTKGVAKPKKEFKKSDKKKKDEEEQKDETCIQVRYSAERKQGAGWAGIYWQDPPNNWGDMRGGWDLTGFTKLLFYAKGEKGGEFLDKFIVGGINGTTEEGDSDQAMISPLELTDKWVEYEIDLTGLDMSHIIGGFGFAANSNSNPEGFTIYVDEVRFVK